MISEECNDNWVDMAVADETIVANLLLSLNNNNNNNNNENNDSPSLQNLHWTVRKRRTTWHTPNTATAKKTESAARASPTTPLSWSAATSASGAADGSEDSSRPTNKPVVALDASRSKVDSQSETAVAAAAAANKRRKKRTLSELHEEEELLLKERNDLKDELASLQLTVDKHRATNRNLKRIKLTLASRGKTSKTATKTAATSPVAVKAVLDTPQLVEAQVPVTVEAVLDPPQVVEAQGSHHPSESESVSPPQTVQERVPDAAASPVCEASTSSPKQQETSEQRPNFVLPDLNLPLEEEFNSNVVPDIS